MDLELIKTFADEAKNAYDTKEKAILVVVNEIINTVKKKFPKIVIDAGWILDEIDAYVQGEVEFQVMVSKIENECERQMKDWQLRLRLAEIELRLGTKEKK